MNNQFIEARELIAKAREALRHGDKASARQWGEQAALRAPQMEDAWLVLAASDPEPKEALAYARKALELNPQSMRAQRAVEWTSGRLKPVQAPIEQTAPSAPVAPARADAVTSLPRRQTYQTAVAIPQVKSKGQNWLLPALLVGAGCVLAGFLLLFALTSPAVASIVSSMSAPAPTQEKLWAQVEIAKPGATPVNGNTSAIQAANTSTAVPTAVVPTSAPSESPAEIATEAPIEAAPSSTPAQTETPGTLAMERVADTPTSEYVAPTYAAPQDQIASAGSGERWIDVDLTNQMVYAYEGDTVVNSFVVSTGVWATPTVTGKYKVYLRLRSGDMRGPGYYLPDVPYIMYFYKSYGLHGTYWHHNFGTPMSHGCVNLSTDDAAWLYNWSSLGTVVNVHY